MRNRQQFVLALSAAFALGLLATGCSRAPAVQFHNLKLVSSLRTALSAQNTQWLDGVAKAVEARHDDGEMSDDEFEHFGSLIAAARRGEWKQAERECFEFEEAQLNRYRDPPKEEHAHMH